MRVSFLRLLMAAFLVSASGCTAFRINLFGGDPEPLREFTIEGQAKGKVLVISVRGVISDAPRKRVFTSQPGTVEALVAQLRKAKKDPQIKAIVLKVDSPGGTTTASDILYRELLDFKQQTGAVIVAALMGVAASGGYYISLPADFILAHPTTLTGSIGVIFLRPGVSGLMGKLGLEVEVAKSGANKDMGSPFRPPTAGERTIFQSLTDRLGERFLQLVSTHRRLTPEALSDIATARVYLAPEALGLGLIDQIGYLPDALGEARRRAALPEDSRVIVYRRREFPDDTLYNPQTGFDGGLPPAVVDLGHLTDRTAGFYYLWPAAAFNE